MSEGSKLSHSLYSAVVSLSREASRDDGRPKKETARRPRRTEFTFERRHGLVFFCLFTRGKRARKERHYNKSHIGKPLFLLTGRKRSGRGTLRSLVAFLSLFTRKDRGKSVINDGGDGRSDLGSRSHSRGRLRERRADVSTHRG